MNIAKTANEDGLFFGYFEDAVDAEEWLEEQVRRYNFTPHPGKMSVRRICKEAQEKGIKLYPNTFANELERRDIDIRGSVGRKESSKESRTFTIDKNVSDQLRQYPGGMMSTITELGLRIVMGFPTEDVIIFIPEEEGQTTLFFHKKREKRIQLYLSDDVDLKFEQQLRNVLERSEKQGMEAVIRYAEESGFKWYGGTQI